MEALIWVVIIYKMLQFDLVLLFVLFFFGACEINGDNAKEHRKIKKNKKYEEGTTRDLSLNH